MNELQEKRSCPEGIPDDRQALREAWMFVPPKVKREVLAKMKLYDQYCIKCAEYLEAAYDNDAEI